MQYLYKLGSFLIRTLFFFLPKATRDRWDNKDTQGAVVAALGVAVLIAAVWKYGLRVVLSAISLFMGGCYGLNAFAEYEHHSSIPMVSDANTTDQAGVTVDIPLANHRYATRMEIGMHWELDRDKPVFGDDPVGTIRLRQPIFRGTP